MCWGDGSLRGSPPHLPLSPPAALTVKFLTKRFISEYDPNLGKTLFPRVFPPLPRVVPTSSNGASFPSPIFSHGCGIIEGEKNPPPPKITSKTTEGLDLTQTRL